MVLEVVGTGSQRKDVEILHNLYWRAGVAEYWLFAVHSDRLDFDLLRRKPARLFGNAQGIWLAQVPPLLA
jgi:hypothetical protein